MNDRLERDSTMTDRRHRHLVAAALAVAAIAALLALAAADWANGQEPAHVYVYPSRPPGIPLWPQAPYTVNCAPGTRNLNIVEQGAIRNNNGVWEVLTQGDFRVWAPFDPQRPLLDSLIYYRIGDCWQEGHGHGQDGEVGASEDDWFPVVHGRAPTEMEKADIKWSPIDREGYGLRWLKIECNKRRPDICPPVPPRPTPTPRPRPTPTPRPTATPQPTATPAPTATPCPSPTPCPDCPTERMPLSVRATINKGLSSLGRQWRGSVAEARAWLDAHPLFVPNDNSTSGSVGALTLEGEWWVPAECAP